MLCDVVSRESLPGSAPVRNPLVFPDLQIEEQGRIVEPALGRAAPVAGLGDLALVPLPAHGPAVKSVTAGTRLGHCPPACGRDVADRGLLTAIGRVRSRSVSRRDRSQSSDRYRSSRDLSRRDRSRSSDRYRSRRERSRSPSPLS